VKGRHLVKIRLSQTLCLAILLLACLSAGQAQQAQVTSLPPLQTQSVENAELLVNADCEKPDTGWRFTDWPPRPDTYDRLIAKSIFYSHDVVHSGQYALCYDLRTVGSERTLAITQTLSRDALAPYDGRRLRLSGWLWLASGPGYYNGTLGMRQWGEPGTPPFGGANMDIGGSRGEWSYVSREFVFHLGETKRADVNVWLRNIPDPTIAPVVFVDDVKLEVLADPPLVVELLAGRVISRPDTRLPLRVKINPASWQEGLRSLRWDVTTPDGRRSWSSAHIALTEPLTLIELPLPGLAEGPFALRVALGKSPGDRNHEVLLPFQMLEGPFAHR
jgi:hypothetical protein